jgi:TolB protein
MRVFVTIILALVNSCFSAPLRVEITKGQIKPEPIAILSFVNDDLLINEIVEKDLMSCGVFEMVPRDTYLQNSQDVMDKGPILSRWKITRARFVLCGRVEKNSNNLTVHFRLYDIFSGKAMLSLSLKGFVSQFRRLAHMVADEVFSRVTNESGYFNTQITFVETLGRFKKGAKSRIVMMDRDGHNFEKLTDGPLDITPRFSPKGDKLAFLSFKNGNAAQVYLLDLKSKQQKVLGHFKGMTYAPRFAPEGKDIVFSFIDSKNGNNSICLMNLESKSVDVLTDQEGIDTSPCFSHTGNEIAFVSNRGEKLGAANIFIMNRQGGNLRRITFGDGRYYQPVWSPRGDLIAFVKLHEGRFYLGVIAPDGSGERLITRGYLIESPVWTSNGRYLFFTKENGPNQKSTICFIDITGFHLQTLDTKGRDASHCDTILIQ